MDVAALQQANAGGANESFLVNGSLSTALQTQASDFTPDQGPNAFGSGVASAAVGGAGPAQGGAAAAGPGGFLAVVADLEVVVSEDVAAAVVVSPAGAVAQAVPVDAVLAVSSAIAATPARTRFADRSSTR